MTMIIDMTPHPVTVECPDGHRVTFAPCGIVPRVEQVRTTSAPVCGIPVAVATVGAVVDAPPVVPGTIYIVSTMVAQAAGRDDMVAPDTGPSAIRDEAGHIVAVRGFVRFPRPDAVPVAAIAAAMDAFERAVAAESSGYMAACIADAFRRRVGIPTGI